LTISSKTPLDLVKLRDIHFGHKDVDFNICEGDLAHYYRIAVGPKDPDLSGNSVSLYLYNFDETFINNRLDLTLTMQILNTTKDLDPHETIPAK